MDPELLRILMTVERCLRITNTAVEHHIRQPWVAQQIKLLEKELTEAGRLLLKYANRKKQEPP